MPPTSASKSDSFTLLTKELLASWVAPSAKLPETWSPDSLIRYGKNLECKFAQGLSQLAEMSSPQPPPTCFGFGTPSLFGPDTSLHAFQHRSFLRGFRLLEPQVTSMLQHILDPTTAGPQAIDRSSTLLTALFRAGNFHPEPGVDFKLEILQNLQVVCEESFTHAKSRRFIDLLFKWEVNGEPRAVAVENKLNHHITKDQLPSYRAQVLKNVGMIEKRMALFVIAPEFTGPNAISLKRNKSWKGVTWWDLMRHWEQALIEKKKKTLDNDPDFPRLRRAIWTVGAGIG